MARFSVYLNDELVKAYDLNDPVIFIGRLPENQIPISNMGISRRHVKIELEPHGGYVISDLNSLNGTLVNGKRVKKAQLAHGDKIAVGKHTIVYEEIGGHSAYLETIVAEVKPEELRAMAQAAGLKASPPPATRQPPQPQPQQPKQQQSVPHPPPEVTAPLSPINAQVAEATLGCPVLIEATSHVVYKLDRNLLTIGSDNEDDIYANGFRIGKEHAVVELRDGGYYISAQKMMAKLKINGQNIRTHRLEHRDRIEIGSNTFRFMENG